MSAAVTVVALPVASLVLWALLRAPSVGELYAPQSNGFPTANAHQPECGDITHGGSYCYQDATIFVLNPSGVITYASYHGGSAVDSPTVIDTDGNGNVLIAGNTTSGEFPLANPLQATCCVTACS